MELGYKCCKVLCLVFKGRGGVLCVRTICYIDIITMSYILGLHRLITFVVYARLSFSPFLFPSHKISAVSTPK